jgi:hypothetical protein
LNRTEVLPTRLCQDQRDMTISGNIRSKTGSSPISTLRLALCDPLLQAKRSAQTESCMVPKSPAARPLLGRFRNRNNIRKRRENSLKVQKHSMSIAEACSTRKTSSDALAHILMEVVLTSQAQERTGRLVSFQSQQFRLLNKTKVK